HNTGYCFIVIASNAGLRQATDLFADLCRVSSVANNIAKTNGDIPAPRRFRQRRFECSEVSVDITENEDPHARCSKSATEYRRTGSRMHEAGVSKCVLDVPNAK